jgi:ABC-2 type transport system permease protein
VSPAASTLHVAGAIMRRSIKHTLKSPALLVPSLLFPLIFLIGFAGGLSSLGDVPGFSFPSGYTAFQFVFVFLQSAAFGGVFSGFGIAMDFESGFSRRIMLAAPHRFGMIVGYMGSALFRYALTGVVVTVAALIGGMRIDGSAVDLAGLVALGVVVNVAATLWAGGLAMRAKTVQAGPAMQIPIFLLLFLAPVYVPLDLLQGWIEAVASWNPLTAIVQAGRGFISGEPAHSALAFACGLGMAALLMVWAVTGLRRAEREV